MSRRLMMYLPLLGGMALCGILAAMALLVLGTDGRVWALICLAGMAAFMLGMAVTSRRDMIEAARNRHAPDGDRR